MPRWISGRSRAAASSRSPRLPRRPPSPPAARPHPDGRAVITPSPEDEAALDATKAPLMEHLLELRVRLIWSVVSFGICFAICFAFSKQILAFLERPLSAVTNHLIYTALPEIFFTQIKVAMFGGACLGFPVIAAQLWMFVAPGLYKHEKRAF